MATTRRARRFVPIGALLAMAAGAAVLVLVWGADEERPPEAVTLRVGTLPSDSTEQGADLHPRVGRR